MDEADDALREAFMIADQMLDKLVTISGGRGELIVGSLAVMLANFETQHKDTINDVVEGARLILLMNEDAAKLRASKPPSETIN